MVKFKSRLFFKVFLSDQGAVYLTKQWRPVGGNYHRSGFFSLMYCFGTTWQYARNVMDLNPILGEWLKYSSEIVYKVEVYLSVLRGTASSDQCRDFWAIMYSTFKGALSWRVCCIVLKLGLSTLARTWNGCTTPWWRHELLKDLRHGLRILKSLVSIFQIRWL